MNWLQFFSDIVPVFGAVWYLGRKLLKQDLAIESIKLDLQDIKSDVSEIKQMKFTNNIGFRVIK